MKAFIPLAREAGLDAIETRYSLFAMKECDELSQIAKEYNLLESGGSDYHGVGKPHIALGLGNGNLAVPVSFYLQLLRKFQH